MESEAMNMGQAQVAAQENAYSKTPWVKRKKRVASDASTRIREYEMRAFAQTSTNDSPPQTEDEEEEDYYNDDEHDGDDMYEMYREGAGTSLRSRNALRPNETPCPDFMGEAMGAKKFMKTFQCSPSCEELEGVSDTLDECRPPGEGGAMMGHHSKQMRRTCFIRPSHLIMGIRKPRDAPIAITPGVRVGPLLARTEKLDKSIGATFDKFQDNTRGILDLGNDPFLAENMKILRKEYDDLTGVCDALRMAHLDVSSRAMVLDWVQKIQLTDEQLEESRKQLQRQADDLVEIHKLKQAEVMRMLSMAQSTLKNIDDTIDTIQFVKMCDAERRDRVTLEENQVAAEFANLVGSTLGALPQLIDWMLIQFCSRGSLFARILKFAPLYLACSNGTDANHAGMLNATGIDNPKELSYEISYAKKTLIGALANSREYVRKALKEYMRNYMDNCEVYFANRCQEEEDAKCQREY